MDTILKSVVLSVVAATTVTAAEPAPSKSPYAASHAPATRSAYLPLPPGAVEPRGWLRDWCEQVRDGFTLRMEEVHPAFKQAWAADHKMTGRNLFWESGGWPYEGGGYWFEGLAGMAAQLKDDRLTALAQRRFDAIVTNMNDKSILFYWWLDRNNPADLKAAEGREMRETAWPMWAAGLLGRALVRQYAVTGDPRVLKTLETAYAGHPDWVKLGWAGSNPWPAFATYGWTGNARIAAGLDGLYRSPGDEAGQWTWGRYSRMPQPKDGNDHGVHFLESTTAWALGYLWTGKREFLDATLAWHRLVERDGMQPYGVPVFDEHYGAAGVGRKTETCDVAGFIWSKNMLLWITGEGALADQVERAFFNAAPGVFGRDGRTHAYLQPPNYLTGGGQATYQRAHHPLCCTAALNRILPEYVSGMWLATHDGGLVAVGYGPAVLNALVGDKVKVRVETKTAYPFEETIALKIEPERTVEFPLSLRLPGWCAAPAIRVNGQPITLAQVQGFQRIQRTWKAGDQVAIQLPMRTSVAIGLDRNAKNAPFASVHCGPLLFALPIGAEARGGEVAAPWQYALAGTAIKVERDTMPARWDWPVAAPLRLKVAAQQVAALPGLVADDTSAEVTLVPYGCAKFRVAMFPVTQAAWKQAGGADLPVPVRAKPWKLREGKGVTYAADLKWTTATAGAENAMANRNYKQQPLRIGGQEIPKGLWTHAFNDATPADIVFDLQGRNFVAFRALVGLDDLGTAGSIQFQVLVDGQRKVETPVLRAGESQVLDVDVKGAREITLRVLNGDDGYAFDQAVWGLARFLEPGATDVVEE